MKTWALFIGSWCATSWADHHSVRTCASRHEACVHMWALAKCRQPQTAWMQTLLDGVVDNRHMRSLSVPRELFDEVTSKIQRLDELAAMELDGASITVRLIQQADDSWSYLCPDMRSEGPCSNEAALIEQLREEYADQIEAELGIRPFVRVTLHITQASKPTLRAV